MTFKYKGDGFEPRQDEKALFELAAPLGAAVRALRAAEDAYTRASIAFAVDPVPREVDGVDVFAAAMATGPAAEVVTVDVEKRTVESEHACRAVVAQMLASWLEQPDEYFALYAKKTTFQNCDLIQTLLTGLGAPQARKRKLSLDLRDMKQPALGGGVDAWAKAGGVTALLERVLGSKLKKLKLKLGEVLERLDEAEQAAVADLIAECENEGYDVEYD